MQARFALVEAGLTRSKNVSNIMMMNLMDMSVSGLPDDYAQLMSSVDIAWHLDSLQSLSEVHTSLSVDQTGQRVIAVGRDRRGFLLAVCRALPPTEWVSTTPASTREATASPSTPFKFSTTEQVRLSPNKCGRRWPTPWRRSRSRTWTYHPGPAIEPRHTTRRRAPRSGWGFVPIHRPVTW